jgi:glycosyltransferase involved in cell wall biosynthesis
VSTLRKNISVVVLTYNEETNIGECLRSIKFDAPMFVVDSGSNDRTVNIAEAFGAVVVIHPYENHAAQWEWAIENLPIETPWILALDADFTLSPKLSERIREELDRVPADVGGIYVRHLYRFAGGVIRFGGTKQYWLRIVRRGRARPDRGDLVDFRFVVQGRTLRWKEPVIEYNRKDDDISVWLQKQDKFALRLAVEEELRRRGMHCWSGVPSVWGNVDERFAWLRDRWLHLPLFVRAFLYGIYRYVVAGGFLDGRSGFLYHFLQGMWLRTLVDVKILEIRALGLDGEQLGRFARLMLTTKTGSVGEVARLLAQDLACKEEPWKGASPVAVPTP